LTECAWRRKEEEFL
jgi:hypothetical protein